VVAAIVQVKLEIDVKAGLQAKVIAVDEAKAMGAYHVILDRSCDLSSFSSFLIDSISLIHTYSYSYSYSCLLLVLPIGQRLHDGWMEIF
jgi:hypothetical protein